MQRDDEEAAKVYEEFVKDFGGADNEDPGKKAFVRGGVIQPGQQSSSSSRKDANPTNAEPEPPEKQKYVPPLAPPPRDAINKVVAEFADDEEVEDDKAEGELAFKPPPSSRGKRRRMDILLENMKK